MTYCYRTVLLIFPTVFFNTLSFSQAPNIRYQTPQTYTINTTITPLGPTNTGGAVPATIYGQVTTFAGSGVAGFSNGQGTAASFNTLYNLTIDKSLNIYVADYNNQAIRKITSTGAVTTLAGNGYPGSINGVGAQASFYSPGGITTDASGNIYVGDQNNNVIRMITPAGIVSTFAGDGSQGSSNGSLLSASFNGPAGLSFDNGGNLFIADRNNNLIRKITPADAVSTFAGGGSANLSNCTGVATDQSGNVYVTDQFNNLIRKITPTGLLSTFAGSGIQGATNATGNAASFNKPFALTVDLSGTVYVADEFNNLIRAINGNGVVRTLAGDGSQGDNDAIGTAASFNYPSGTALDGIGNLFISEAIGNRIRKVVVTGYTIDKLLPAGLTFDQTTGIISGKPVINSPATDYTVTAYNVGGSSTTIVNIAVTGVNSGIQPPNISYQTPQTYLINQPIGSLTPTNTGGSVPATIYGQVSTFAGNGSNFNTTTGVAIDAAGNIFFEDWGNNLIKKMTPAGVLSTFAGSGSIGSANGQGTAASFYEPDGLVIDAAGNLYVGDEENNLIRRITPGGLVSTLAGSGNGGYTDGTGTLASFSIPRGLAVDLSGNVYVADQGNNTIRKITPFGVVTTIAGNINAGFVNGTGASATFNTPTGVGIDVSGNLYVADAGNGAIRKITATGVVTTYATGFNYPREVRADGTGNVYVTEQYGNVIKRISSTGVITTIAGTGQIGATNGNGNLATFNGLIGLLIDGNGNLYVGDSANNLIRKITVSGYTIDKALPAGLSFDQTTGIISGTPTVSSPATVYTVTAYNGGGSNSTIVSIEVDNFGFGPISAKTVCDADFDPGANGSSIIYTSSNVAVATIIAGKIHITGAGTSIITATSGGVNLQQTLTVTPALVPAVTIAASPATPLCSGSSITFTATVVNGGGAPTYQWEVNGVNAGTNSNQFISNTFAYNDNVSCTIINNDNSCLTSITASSNTVTANIIAPASPSVSISASTNNVYPGTLITFTAKPLDAGTAFSYQWQVNGTNAGTDSPVFSSMAFRNGDEVTCIILMSIGCTPSVLSNTITVIVVPAPTVTITNTFTPNGDGVNDLWDIPDLVSYPNCLVSIFNRYGALLYQSRGYNKAWNGTYKGSPLPMSTYYYVIDLGYNSSKLSGSITIVK